MKRAWIAIFLCVVFSGIYHEKAYALVSCPSSSMTCGELGSKGGCTSPCIRVVTRAGGPGGRGGSVPAQCACQMPNQQGTVPVGGECQRDSDCASPGKYCWGPFHQKPTCHVEQNPRTSGPDPVLTKLCDYVNSEQQEDCRNCVENEDKPAVWTAIGCVHVTLDGFVGAILPFAIGIAGGIAFLLILFGALQIMTSAGNPEKLNAGRELVTSAIVGLLLIIFSVFILQLIGVQILRIPGFT